MPTNTIERITKELLRMEEDCTYSGKSHFNASARWLKMNYYLGVPAIALSPLAGIAYTEGFSKIAWTMSAAVAALTALMTFLRPSELSSKHKTSGDQYLSLRNDARVFREIQLLHLEDEQTAINSLAGLTKRRNELNQASPQFSNRDFRKARIGITKGEAQHKVDIA